MPRISPQAARERSRFRGLTLLVLLGGAVLAALLVVGELRVRRSAMHALAVGWTELASEAFRDFERPVRAQLTLVREWSLSGELDLSDPERLDTRLAPLLDALDQVAAVSLVGRDGAEYRRERREEGWSSQSSSDDRLGLAESAWYLATSRNEAGRPSWTGSGAGATRPRRGVTAALRWSAAPARQPHAVAFDITRESIRALASRLPAAPSGLLLIEGSGGIVHWLPLESGERFVSDDLASLLRSDAGQSGLIGEALCAWHRRGPEPGGATRVRWEDRAWWLRVVPLDLPGLSGLGLLVPERTLAEGLETTTSPFTWTLLGLVAIAVGALARLTLSYRRRVAALARPRAPGPARDLEHLRGGREPPSASG
jgi:hypothetical protein